MIFQRGTKIIERYLRISKSINQFNINFRDLDVIAVGNIDRISFTAFRNEGETLDILIYVDYEKESIAINADGRGNDKLSPFLNEATFGELFDDKYDTHPK